jgi:hypothetical protein
MIKNSFSLLSSIWITSRDLHGSPGVGWSVGRAFHAPLEVAGTAIQKALSEMGLLPGAN